MWCGTLVCGLTLAGNRAGLSEQASATPMPSQQAAIEASPLPTIIQAPKRDRLPGWTNVRIYWNPAASVQKGLLIQQFVKYLDDDPTCDIHPCYLLYNRVWSTIDSYSKFPDGETAFYGFRDGQMNEYRQRVYFHATISKDSPLLYKYLYFPFPAKGKWSWGFTDVNGISFSMMGESLGWEKPPGMEDLPWPTVHVRVNGTCLGLCTTLSHDFTLEYYYAPEIEEVVWLKLSGNYSAALAKTTKGQWLVGNGVLPLPSLPPIQP